MSPSGWKTSPPSKEMLFGVPPSTLSIRMAPSAVVNGSRAEKLRNEIPFGEVCVPWAIGPGMMVRA
jgi:hypothetical protein